MKDDIRIFSDPESLAQAAGKIFADAANHAITEQGRCSIALSGGSTPRELFRALTSAYLDSITWEKVHLFWSDERSVPPDHAQSNYRLAYDEMISKIPIPEGNIHRIRGELAPAEAAGEYEMEMARYFGSAHIPVFDLILLGVGQDGHTASLFPDSEALSEKNHFAVLSYSESAGNWRVTLTLPVLNNALDILFLVSGKSKSGIMSKIIEQGRRDHYPAGMVKPSRGRIIWLLDREAASDLKISAC